MELDTYNIRLKTVCLDQFTLATGKKIELVVAEGFGKHAGHKMVKIGDMEKGEEGWTLASHKNY